MNFLKNIFGKKEEPIKSYTDFWNWFQKNERFFFKAVKENANIEKDFFSKLSLKLNELKDGFYYLTGMCNDKTAELVFTAEGAIKNIIFVEELVNAAPKIDGWLFTALKPALDINKVYIEMAGFKFNMENLSFYANSHEDFPDEIDISIVHNDLNAENKSAITQGTFIFLDNFLGELNFAVTIDLANVTGKENNQKELIPIEKLKDYLVWRQKEFIEKYEGSRYNTDDDTYSILEAKLKNGNPLIAAINTDLLRWENKASHPWILKVEIKYYGADNNGMPGNEIYKLLAVLENDLSGKLKDFEGYLNIGRQTADSAREIYFACKDFRKPSRVMHDIAGKYSSKFSITYDVYKDKYWQSFDHFVKS